MKSEYFSDRNKLMKIEGKVAYLDRADIDTDQIIPAKYLTGVSITGLGAHFLEALDLPGFDKEDSTFKEATAIVSRDNFGYGSSREHAVWALEDNGFRVVITPSFASIFRRNMFNRGLIAIELPDNQIDEVFANAWENYRVDLEADTLKFWSGREKTTGKSYNFQLRNFDKTLVLKGGLVGFVVENY